MSFIVLKSVKKYSLVNCFFPNCLTFLSTNVRRQNKLCYYSRASFAAHCEMKKRRESGGLTAGPGRREVEGSHVLFR
jgi:hypothetical protein